MNIYEKLLTVQSKLKAPKSQFNSFGKYNYRNAEDILEAVKPLCKEVGALVVLTDEIKCVGDRHYVEATAKFIDVAPTDNIVKFIDVKASAREEESKKGMDGSQVTGASSSYARKYALNGLFAIDDTKDSDTTNTGDNGNGKAKTEDKKPFEEIPKQEEMLTLEKALDIEVQTQEGVKKLKDLTDEQLKIVKETSKVKDRVKGAELILLYRAGQK